MITALRRDHVLSNDPKTNRKDGLGNEVSLEAFENDSLVEPANYKEPPWLKRFVAQRKPVVADAWSEKARQASAEARRKNKSPVDPWRYVVGSKVRSAVDPRHTGVVERFSPFGAALVLVKWDNGWMEWLKRDGLTDY